MSLKEIIIYIIVAIVIGAISYLWKSNRDRFVAQLVSMVQQMELAVQGSKMGAEKKRLLLQMLEVNGVKATAWISNMIDAIVKALNENQAWITKFCGGGLPASLQSAVDSVTEEE